MNSFKEYIQEETNLKIQTSKFKKWTEGLPMIVLDSDDKATLPKTGFIIKAYHGTEKGGFNKFDTNRTGYHYGEGSYFTPQSAHALGYAKGKGSWYTKGYSKESRLYVTYIKIKKPFITTSDEGVMSIAHKLYNDNPNAYKTLQIRVQNLKGYDNPNSAGMSELGNKLLRDQGYDGVVKQWPNGQIIELVVFYPEQIFIIQKLRRTQYEHI